jgi:hypothetical protein
MSISATGQYLPNSDVKATFSFKDCEMTRLGEGQEPFFEIFDDIEFIFDNAVIKENYSYFRGGILFAANQANLGLTKAVFKNSDILNNFSIDGLFYIQ